MEGVNMMDYEAIKRLGLHHFNIDYNKSFELYDETLNNHIINIYLKKDITMYCPGCGSKNFISRGSIKRKLEFANFAENNITLIWYRKRFKCNDCNHFFQENNPFLDTKKRITIQKDIKILQALKNINSNYTYVAKEFNVSPTYVIDLFDKRVDISKGALTSVICVDEVYTSKLSRNKFCFIIYSPQSHKIIDILDSRKKNVLNHYFENIPKIEKENVQYFSMDLYDNYRLIAKKHFPKAKIVADSFHVIKNLMECFRRLRIRVMKRFESLKYENSNYYWLYKKYWKFLNMDRSKLKYNSIKVNKSNMLLTPRQIVDYMLSLDDTLKRAYELKEEYLNFNFMAKLSNCEQWLDEIIYKFQIAQINEYIPFWKLLKNWRIEIINSFNYVDGKRVSNGPMERANRDIKTILRLSFGSTNFTRMRNRIMWIMNDDSAMLYSSKKYSNKRKSKARGPYKK